MLLPLPFPLSFLLLLFFFMQMALHLRHPVAHASLIQTQLFFPRRRHGRLAAAGARLRRLDNGGVVWVVAAEWAAVQVGDVEAGGESVGAVLDVLPAGACGFFLILFFFESGVFGCYMG